MIRYGLWGTGPGHIAPDGSAVDLYAKLEAADEPRILAGVVPTGGTILELGCGTGRMTRALATLGHWIHAVDESTEMLSRLALAEPGSRVRTVRSTIEELRLDLKFDCVLLASHLINVPDPDARRSMLETCRHHLAPGGAVIVQRHDPAMLAAPFVRENDGKRFEVREIEYHSNNVTSAILEYRILGDTWVQKIRVENLDDEQLGICMGEAGLRIDGFLTPDRTWVCGRSA